jgi:hypothetical protein
VDQLAELNGLGLQLFYVACESGDDLVLERIVTRPDSAGNSRRWANQKLYPCAPNGNGAFDF